MEKVSDQKSTSKNQTEDVPEIPIGESSSPRPVEEARFEEQDEKQAGRASRTGNEKRTTQSPPPDKPANVWDGQGDK